MANKMTKKEIFTAMLQIPEIQENEVYKSTLEHEIELLNKKATNKKPTKTQEENIVLKTKVMAFLAEQDEAVTVAYIKDNADGFDGLTTQKVSALLRMLVNDGRVTRTYDKKTALFAVADGEE